jgi:hypothetical protein
MSLSLELLSCIDFDTRVTGAVVREDGASVGDTMGVLVEKNIALILDELTLPEDAVHFSPAARPSFKLDTSLSETTAKSSSSFPSERR